MFCQSPVKGLLLTVAIVSVWLGGVTLFAQPVLNEGQLCAVVIVREVWEIILLSQAWRAMVLGAIGTLLVH
jgi:hypothetical protein